MLKVLCNYVAHFVDPGSYGSHQRLKREDSISLSCNGTSLTESDSFKYLGVAIDQHFKFYCNNHIEHVVNTEVSKKLGVLRRLKISFLRQ